MEENDDKVYFQAGDVVTLRLNIPNKPIMYVIKKETSMFKHLKRDNVLKGIRCRWFTTNLEPLEEIFNTKDLLKID